MSMFLGPIHKWLYNKIQTGAERSSAIEGALKNAFTEDFDAIMADVDDKYPALPAGLDLEDIIGDSPIHGFLSGLIRMVETREGALVKAFVDRYGDSAQEVILSAAREYGLKAGEGAKGEILAGDMESLFRALYDRQLDGMPCDQGAKPEIQGNRLMIRQSECLHSDNWKEAGAPLDLMCRITGAWMEGFVKGAAPDSSYSIEDSVVSGAGSCLYSISRS